LLPSYTLFEVSFEPDDLMQLPSDELPEDWQAYPAPLSTAQIGDQWLQSQASALLAVPSVIVPGEYNYLLNPAHSRFQIITQQARAIDFQMDSRLL
ncbi:MAG: RES family NAD+ phosphorylase, partial [Cellvibrionaceae bacterium]|nr:RES family NAD+ phosphorylase [Cellvibrionaceae bacterium]